MQNLVKFHRLVLKKKKKKKKKKILRGKEILTSIKGHDSVINLRKLTRNNPNLDLVNINAYAKFGQIIQFVLKILSENEILTSFKGHNSVINLQKLTCNNPNLALGQIPSIHSQDIEWT